MLKCLRKVVGGQILCVFGVDGERNRAKRRLMVRTVEQGADVAIVTHDNSRDADPHAALRDVASDFQRPERATVVVDRVEAIQQAFGAARPGDCVLIVGKGHEGCSTIGDPCLPRDDRDVARCWLYENAEAIATGRNDDRNRKN